MSQRSHKTVLVVDDAQDIADLVATLLRMNGCNAVTAHDGKQGVAAAIQYKPDLILMDIRMPVMDGYEATRRILSIPELSHTPVIAVSAHCDGDWAERAYDAGCIRCVAKPVEALGLQTLVEDVIGKC